jgi:hypothetical protein
MMRITRTACLPLFLLTTGCLQGQRVIKVNANGSGTIVDTVTLGEQARGMLEGMAAMDTGTPAEKKAKAEAKLKERAAAMGPGVSLASFEPSAKAGAEKITYAFTDVSKIRIDSSPDPSENDSKSEPKQPLTFRLEKKGGTSVLTVIGAGPKPGAKKDAASADSKEAAEAAAKMQAGAMAMMKTMLKGLRMTTLVEVGGKLVKTSSPWAQGSSVTLMDVDFDQLVADEASFKKLNELGDPQSLDPAALKGLKGIKMQTTPETTIEFN